MEKILFIVRGLPGAGKSTFANEICDIVVEADQYFIDSATNEYKFDITKIKDAHKWCFDECEKHMINGNKIAVSNTFTQEWEMTNYFDLAKRYSYKVFSVIVENRNETTSIHNLPSDTIEKMDKRFQIKLR